MLIAILAIIIFVILLYVAFWLVVGLAVLLLIGWFAVAIGATDVQQNATKPITMHKALR